jgi:hypothetical protein
VQRLGTVHALLVMGPIGVYLLLVLGVERQYLVVMGPIGVYLLLVLGVERQYLVAMEPSGVHLVLVLGVQHRSVTELLCPHLISHFKVNTISGHLKFQQLS